jgi:hypothetical protein
MHSDLHYTREHGPYNFFSTIRMNSNKMLHQAQASQVLIESNVDIASSMEAVFG